MSPASDDRRRAPGRHPAHTREHLMELLEPLVGGAGYDLEDITVSAAGRRSLIRVIVDADGGIDMDAVAAVARLVSETLDTDPSMDAGEFAGPYVLEVSSPGVDRPLTEPRHWRRAVGRLVTVPVRDDGTDGTDGREQRVTGRVLGADGAGLELDVSGRDGGPRTLGWNVVGAGTVQVEFNRKPGESDAEPAAEPDDDLHNESDADDADDADEVSGP